MKKIFICLACLSLLCNISCDEDSLDTTPKTEFSSDAVWSDPALVESFINQIYFRLDDPLRYGKMKACLVDEAHYRGNGGSFDFNNSLITPDKLPGWTSVSNYDEWNNLYKTVRSCNLFFENIDQVTFDSETLKNRMVGEASFLRASIYFNLVRIYGGVPIITKVYGLNDDFEIARNSFAECVDFIVKDLDAAAALLPLEYTGDDIGRATKGAALSLKSRVLLYAASDLYHTDVFPGYTHKELIGYVGGDQKACWQKAKDAAKAVIDLGIYKLYKADPSPADNIADNITGIYMNKQTEEDIFVKYYTPVERQNFGLYTGPNGYHNWGSNAPIADLVDDYEMADGSTFDWNNPVEAAHPYENREPRFYANILYEGASWRIRPADVQKIDPENRIQVGTWEVWDAATNSIIEKYGVDTRKSTIEDWNGSYTGYYNRKYLDPNVDAQYFKQEVTWRYIRYAEILLNYAEACNELGEDAEACQAINQIRHRAGLPDIKATGDNLKQIYRHERRIELSFEEHRIFDVRRWMIGPEAYKPIKRAIVRYELLPDKTTATEPTITHEVWETHTWKDCAYFFPIWRDEMNKNPQLIQNPGYE